MIFFYLFINLPVSYKNCKLLCKWDIWYWNQLLKRTYNWWTVSHTNNVPTKTRHAWNTRKMNENSAKIVILNDVTDTRTTLVAVALLWYNDGAASDTSILSSENWHRCYITISLSIYLSKTSIYFVKVTWNLYQVINWYIINSLR